MISKFVQRTILRHLVFVGVGYLIVRILWVYFRPENPADIPIYPPLVSLVTLFAAICYPSWVRKYRPIPQNPIQQFQINALIAAYAFVVGLSVAFPLHAGGFEPWFVAAWPLVTFVFVYWGWGLLYSVDHDVVQDPTGRRMTPWQLAMHQAKKYRTRFQRSTSPWHRS